MTPAFPSIPGIVINRLHNESPNTALYIGYDKNRGGKVAIKYTNCGVSSRRRSSLIAEGRLLARLDHPNIVKVYSCESSGDAVYMIMEYIRGPKLEELKSQNVDHFRMLVPELMAQVLGALDYLHSHFVVHRDLSPSNILIDTDNKRAVLIDFGASVMRDAHVPFTPGFSSLERISNEPPDPAMDIYSAGAVFEWMISGDDLARSSFGPLIRDMMAENPQARPLPGVCLRRLTRGESSASRHCLWLTLTFVAVILILLVFFVSSLIFLMGNG